MQVSIADFPRCAGYIKAMNVRLDDPEMTDYWYAVLVADAFTDDFLTEKGTVDFKAMDGLALLGEFERLLSERPARTSSITLDSLRAFMGSRGVKASKLETDADYWQVARLLWPQAVKKNAGGSLTELHAIISRMTKRSRQSAALNIHKVPAKWRAA